MNKKPPPSVWESLALAGQLGFTIAIPLALGAILGNYFDGITHQKTLFLLLGLLLGLIIGIYGAYRLFARLF
jgi:ATP synthase protein I